MICKHCGLANHKCSSADEYHADDRSEYMKELNGFALALLCFVSAVGTVVVLFAQMAEKVITELTDPN